MRRGNPVFIVVAVLLCVLIPAAGAITLTLNASENEAHVGDAITLSGKVTGIRTIAVYLFVIGPDLNKRGVTLDNLNIPAGRGLFTTAPVHMRTAPGPIHGIPRSFSATSGPARIRSMSSVPRSTGCVLSGASTPRQISYFSRLTSR